ncbi:PH domain-containing protein (plasmid) [Ralstonia syzygii subsp. celebesensis]
MGSYINKSLVAGEAVVGVAKVSWIPHLPSILLGILTLPVYGLGLLILVGVWLTIWTTELAVTNRKVIAKVGFIRRDTIEMLLGKVESVQVKQSIFGRIFNYGTIIISGAGIPRRQYATSRGHWNFDGRSTN